MDISNLSDSLQEKVYRPGQDEVYYADVSKEEIQGGMFYVPDDDNGPVVIDE